MSDHQNSSDIDYQIFSEISDIQTNVDFPDGQILRHCQKPQTTRQSPKHNYCPFQASWPHGKNVFELQEFLSAASSVLTLGSQRCTRKEKPPESMDDSGHKYTTTGIVKIVIGAVIDMQFQDFHGGCLVLEVASHLGELNTVHTIVMDSMKATLGPIMNINGKPIDKCGPIEGVKLSPIHADPPVFIDHELTAAEVLETSIKVIDLLVSRPVLYGP
ncbi:hypothetical protein EDD16DRAFT_1516121 [Pisolithus croceorrhizus]|nr:hypothetical protein EDD16DRAFT_1516121 [Pisolithus croceorrhizus]